MAATDNAYKRPVTDCKKMGCRQPARDREVLQEQGLQRHPEKRYAQSVLRSRTNRQRDYKHRGVMYNTAIHVLHTPRL